MKFRQVLTAIGVAGLLALSACSESTSGPSSGGNPYGGNNPSERPSASGGGSMSGSGGGSMSGGGGGSMSGGSMSH